MRCGWPIRVFRLNGHSRQFFSQQFSQTSLSRLVVMEIDNCLRYQRPPFRGWRFLQDLPCLALQRVLLVGAENVLLAALVHPPSPPEIAATARS